GSVGYIGNALNQMVITIPILIITLALADCVHLFSIFFQQRVKGHSSKESMVRSLELNLQPLFLTTLTTCIGFLSFNVLDVPPLKDLGNYVSIGIAMAFIFTIFFAAPLFSFFEIKPPKSVNQQINFSRKIANFSLRNSKTLLWLVPATSFLLISLIPLNEFDENPTQMYDEGFTSFSKDTLWLDEMLGVTFPVSFKADAIGGSVSDPEFLRKIDNFTQWLETQNEVNHVTSLAHTMKNLNKSMHGDDPEWEKIPDSKDLSSQYLFFYEMSLPMGLDLNSSISQDRSSTKISANLDDMGGTEFLIFDEKIRTHLSENNLTETISPPAGFRVIFSHMSWTIVNSLFIGVILGLFLITILLGLFFRSLKFGVLSAFPNVLPIGAAFGIWALYEGQVGFMVAIGMGSTLGIIVDFTVHLLSKYDLARREMGQNPEEAVMFAFESVGFALIVMTIVISLGFLVLNLVNFMPLHDFARFSTISFIMALIIDFLLFPNLLVKFDKRKF
ncbi:MAG TPA: MMPL family transporter, partial [SAR86 cluster bacterium]|nr:MMPL family transporter [SAR86 cluster bacterium]